MKLTVLGSGSSVPHPNRSSPSFWLETLGGRLLLDIGPDAPHRMAQENLDWPNLDAVWISHFHLDHFGGLAPFLFSLKWAPQTRSRTKTLRLAGPRGLHTLLHTIDDANNYRLFRSSFNVEIIEVGPAERFEILPGVFATTLKTPHTQESLALHLKDHDGKTFVYTGDTGFAEDLGEFGNKVDLLLMECSFRRNKPLQTHLELAEVIRIARECEPGRLILTHFYPEWDGIDIAAEVKSLLSFSVSEATDGLVVII